MNVISITAGYITTPIVLKTSQKNKERKYFTGLCSETYKKNKETKEYCHNIYNVCCFGELAKYLVTSCHDLNSKQIDIIGRIEQIVYGGKRTQYIHIKEYMIHNKGTFNMENVSYASLGLTDDEVNGIKEEVEEEIEFKPINDTIDDTDF